MVFLDTKRPGGNKAAGSMKRNKPFFYSHYSRLIMLSVYTGFIKRNE